MTETPKFWNQKENAKIYKKNGHNKAEKEQINASYGTSTK